MLKYCLNQDGQDERMNRMYLFIPSTILPILHILFRSNLLFFYDQVIIPPFVHHRFHKKYPEAISHRKAYWGICF
ncbi:MAG: hypothetical protein A2161_06655 [Candidatus Schekmanbacteria bacterium RBG_13_48_7]|uniref:Uncharacterized protein n=1 Tax=Candidatus Schekmanbacteria bacterium RBG_13_48_7 TaxID=1817878 RepID=A0A1F7RTX3_9BACT|nr:MAG: hypothetical protein A2161_06655 [Candidatus Schekmanbacteria bacterium RBG_13_48_7]